MKRWTKLHIPAAILAPSILWMVGRRVRSWLVARWRSFGGLFAADTDTPGTAVLESEAFPEEEGVMIWQSVMEMWNDESDRYWTRNNIFLIVNGALLIAITSFDSKPLLIVGTSVFGILFVRIWKKVNRIGKFYVDRWKLILWDIERLWTPKIVTQLPAIQEQSIVARTHDASTGYMLKVLDLIFLLWLVILAQQLYGMISPHSALLLDIIRSILG